MTESVSGKPLVIGLTGGIGSGKTAATKLFRQLQVPVIDADEISRELTTTDSPTLQQIRDHFGSEIFDSQGKLDRAALRQIVFSNSDAKQWLESLLHPLIRQEILARISTSNNDYIILSAPLLLESQAYNFVDRVLVIDLPEDLQLARTIKRDKESPDNIKKIIASQLNRQDRLARADDIISNDRDHKHLSDEVLKLHEFYQAQANHRHQTG